MQEQIKAWAAKFGVQPGQVEAGIGAVLGFIQSKVPAAQFQQLQGLMPMAQQWIQKAGTLPAGGSAGGGGLMGMAGGLLGKLGGGAQGGLGQVLTQLQGAGFKPEAAAQFVPAVLNQLKAEAGPDKFNQLLSSVPALKDMLGGGAGGLMGAAGSLLGKLGGKDNK